MKIIFVGGGTAGHINPALALADYIKEKEPHCKILYVGAKDAMEEKLVPEAGFDFKGITISGFSRKLSLDSIKKNILTIKNIIISSFQSKKILDDFKPDICVGTGGYVSGPLLNQAARMKIPFIIHDSNSFPGVTTKLLSKKAARVLLINKEAAKHIPQPSNIEITGNPVRKKIAEFSRSEAKKNLQLGDGHVILSFGGSLGAHAINKVIADLITKHTDDNNYTFIHGFGKKNHSFEKTLAANGINIKNNPRYIIREYIKNMPECMAAADLVICRSGATTLSELQAAAKPAILIPSPNVAENHQYHNAMALVNEEAASIIEEEDLTPEKLWDEISRILKGKENLLEKYSNNLKKMAITDSGEKIYQIIKNIVNK